MKTKRYTFNVQHACFRCRKVFKIQSHTGYNLRAAVLSRKISGRKPKCEFEEPPHVCPECGGVIEKMGRAFRAPPTNDLEGWQGVELLVRAGFRFGSYSSGGYPTSVREIKEFIAARRKRR
jgi:hypothetical protein